MVIGHSSGEIAAAYAAGHLSQRSALAIAFHRGFMAAASKNRGLPPGAMMAVGLGEHDAMRYLQGLAKGTATIACVNSPNNVTISGDASAIEELASHFSEQGSGIFHRRLNIDTAYHSHHMQAVADDYISRLRGLDTIDPVADSDEITFISSVTGNFKSTGFGPQYWVDNLVSRVRFCDAVQAVARHHISDDQERHIFFVEIGPHSALAGPVRQSIAGSPTGKFNFDYEGVLKRKTNAITSVLNLAGRLFERNVAFDPQAVSCLSTGSDTAKVSLNMPTYSWDHSVKHWHESRLSREYRFRKSSYHDLLGVRIVGSTSREPRWRHMIDLTTLPWLAHHVLNGLPIFPGSGYICMVVEAIIQLTKENHSDKSLAKILFRNVSFVRALVVPNSPERIETQLSLQRRDDGPLSFSFSITSFSDGDWHENCTGLIDGTLGEGSGTAEPRKITRGSASGNETTLTASDFYDSLAAVGTVYGPTFAAVQTLSFDAEGNQASGTVKVPYTASLMPGQHQAPHLIHPTTLDALQHVSLPLIERTLGPGLIMPVHIDELLMAGESELTNTPGSELHVESRLISGQFRKAVAELSVTAGGIPVLLFAGVEVRNLAATGSPTDQVSSTRDMAFAVKWLPDLDYLRTEDLELNPMFNQIVGHICSKTAGISVLVLEGKDEDLSLPFLDAVETCNGSVAVYDRIKDTIELTGQHPGYAYDIVLTTDLKWLEHAPAFLKPSGTLILALQPSSDASDKTWQADVLGTQKNPFEVQVVFYDKILGQSIIIMRVQDVYDEQQPKEIHVLCRSSPECLGSLAEFLATRLRTDDPKQHIMLQPFDNQAVERDTHAGVCTVVIDDGSVPILSDPASFNAAISLLNRASKPILWISSDEDPSMHQITGVARTAYAENDDTRVTTIHVASTPQARGRLFQLLKSCMKRDSAAYIAPQNREREYRVCGNGCILIPRLMRQEGLSYALGSDDHEEKRPVANLSKPIRFLPRLAGDMARASFFECAEDYSEPLAPDEIQLETQSMAVTRSYRTIALNVFVGTVARTGSSVVGFTAGDQVVALGGFIGKGRGGEECECASHAGSSHPRTPQNYVVHLPARVPPNTAAALLLETIGACHSLQNLVGLSPEDTVLIHGAATAAGRAAIAFARSKRARVTVTAVNMAEAHILHAQQGIPLADVLVLQRSFTRRSPRQVFAGKLDAVIQATQDALPPEVLDHLKPFGSVVATNSSATKLPPNATLYNCDTVGLLVAQPDVVSRLLVQAVGVLESIAIDGLDLNVRDITDTREALLLLDTGVYDKLVLQVGPDAVIPVRVRERSLGGMEQGSFIIAGGLGDLGRRLVILLAQRGAKSLITLSRRPADAEEHGKLQTQLEAIQPGCRLHCLQCDITSDKALNEVLSSITHLGLPPVRGVIQSAAVLRVSNSCNSRVLYTLSVPGKPSSSLACNDISLSAPTNFHIGQYASIDDMERLFSCHSYQN